MTIQTDPEGTELKFLRRYGALSGSASRRVLEIGCGDGRLTWRYARSARQVIGIDIQHDDLRIALADTPSDLAKRVGFARADAVHLPFPGEAFDLTIFAWSF
ncbi:MAG: class I SAM-dependent methyltransferase [Anaerolineae bacterium]|jgi:ubiquinone/menaquinone biosynthesis C-methylase UbiE